MNLQNIEEFLFFYKDSEGKEKIVVFNKTPVLNKRKIEKFSDVERILNEAIGFITQIPYSFFEKPDELLKFATNCVYEKIPANNASERKYEISLLSKFIDERHKFVASKLTQK